MVMGTRIQIHNSYSPLGFTRKFYQLTRARSVRTVIRPSLRRSTGNDSKWAARRGREVWRRAECGGDRLRRTKQNAQNAGQASLGTKPECILKSTDRRFKLPSPFRVLEARGGSAIL